MLSTQVKTANIFDPIQDTLDQRIFKDTTPRSRVINFVKKNFVTGMSDYIEDPLRYFKLFFTGSLTTYQYSESSDMDMSVFPDYGALQTILKLESPGEVRKLLIQIVIDKLDGRFIPGTFHPIQNFIVPHEIYPQDMYRPGLRSAWDFENERWFVAPEKDRVHDVATELPSLYHRAADMADKMKQMLDHDPEYAKQLFKQIHKKRTLDQQMGRGDFSEGNIVYKYLLHEGLFDRLRSELGVYIAKKIASEYEMEAQGKVKYPRTYHLPWSPGATSDDKILQTTYQFAGQEIVVTEKLDGENTTVYRDGIHARSLDSKYHPTRTLVNKLQGEIGYQIPNGWRICGENMQGQHSISYNLPTFFFVFSIWDENNNCLSWDDTVEISSMLGLQTVPVLWRGIWNEEAIKNLQTNPSFSEEIEGYVVRKADSFPFSNFEESVAKFVREGHVQTDDHWTQNFEYNKTAVSNSFRVDVTEPDYDSAVAFDENNKEIGWLYIDEDTHKILSVEVVPKWQHKGVATAMLNAVKERGGKIEHHWDNMTPSGEEWAHKVASVPFWSWIYNHDTKELHTDVAHYAILEDHPEDITAETTFGAFHSSPVGVNPTLYHDYAHQNPEIKRYDALDKAREYAEKKWPKIAAKNLSEEPLKVIYDFERDQIILGTPGQVTPRRSKIVGEYDGKDIRLYSTGQEFLNANYLKRLWYSSFPTRDLQNIYFDDRQTKLR